MQHTQWLRKVTVCITKTSFFFNAAQTIESSVLLLTAHSHRAERSLCGVRLSLTEDRQTGDHALPSDDRLPQWANMHCRVTMSTFCLSVWEGGSS